MTHIEGSTPAPSPERSGPLGVAGSQGPSTRIGVRELRNNVATVLRRAAAGERIIVTVDGQPTAQLGPLQAPGGQSLTLDDLIAAGLAVPPARHDRPAAPPAEDVPVDVRPEAIMDELRGTR